MDIMIRENFTKKISDVKQKVLEMGVLVEDAIETTMAALATRC